MIALGKKVRIVRKQHCLTQAQLANAIDASFVTVNRWGNGQTKPNLLTQKAIKVFCASRFIDFSW